jgi:hypothetical protein
MIEVLLVGGMQGADDTIADGMRSREGGLAEETGHLMLQRRAAMKAAIQHDPSTPQQLALQ